MKYVCILVYATPSHHVYIYRGLYNIEGGDGLSGHIRNFKTAHIIIRTTFLNTYQKHNVKL